MVLLPAALPSPGVQTAPVPAPGRKVSILGPSAPGPFTSLAATLALSAAAAASAASRGRSGSSAIARRVIKAPVQIAGAPKFRDDAELNRYRVAFAAEDAEDWRKGRVLSIESGEAGALLVIQVEGSREFVALKQAYRAAGQRAQVRFNGVEETLSIGSPPPDLHSSRGQLWRLKGDIYAGQTKKEAETESLPLRLLMFRPGGAPENVKVGDEVDVGPFTDEGLDLRPILARFQAPALAVFCDGSPEALCTMRAALLAENCATELLIRERTAILLFCQATSRLPASLGDWLENLQDTLPNLSLAEKNWTPSDWQKAAGPTVNQLENLGERVGALVLGSPSFVADVSQKLKLEGVTLISSSQTIHPLARVVEPEQI